MCGSPNGLVVTAHRHCRIAIVAWFATASRSSLFVIFFSFKNITIGKSVWCVYCVHAMSVFVEVNFFCAHRSNGLDIGLIIYLWVCVSVTISSNVYE